jgi:uncharacterized protein YraI
MNRLTIRRPGRAIAVVGALVAVGATTTMALVAGTASAAEPGRCTQNVNVRKAPDIQSAIVAVCQSGKEVQVADSKNGFVHLTDLGGWAAQEFVSVNGAAPAAPASRTTGTTAAPHATTPAPSARTTPSNSRRAPSTAAATATPDPDADARTPSGDSADPTSAPADSGADGQGTDAQGTDGQGGDDQPAPRGGLLG